MQDRDNYWDLIKGIAIIGVMTTHLVGSASLLPGPFFHGFALGLIRQFVCFSVPIFMFVAGYFDIGGSLAKRCRRLIIPYLLWTIVVVSVFKTKDLFHPVQFFVKDILLGGGIGIGYFVVALLQLSILSRIIHRALEVNASKALLWTAALNLFGIGVYYWLALPNEKVLGLGVPAPLPMVAFFCWIFYYTLGMKIRMSKSIFKSSNSIALAVVCFAFMLVEGCCWSDGFIEVEQCRLSAALFSVAVCFAIVGLHCQVPRRMPLVVLGRGSFFVYFTHMSLFIVFYELRKYGLWFSAMSVWAYLIDILLLVFAYWLLIAWAEKHLPLSIRKVIGI